MPKTVKSEKARKRLEATAYHEAGHAVASVNLGRSFRHVTIEPGEDSLGHIMFDRFNRSFNPAIRMNKKAEATIENQVLIGMSGMAAERKFLGRSRRNWRAGSQDIRNAVNLASYVYEDEVLDKYVEFMIARADQMVGSARWWAQIEAVARDLLERSTLTGDEVAAICRETVEDGRRISELHDEAAARDDAESEAVMAEMGVV